jgi:quercetin 2,3-dioxygenase
MPLQEKVPEGVVPGAIPIHADFLFEAGIIPVGEAFVWKVAGGRGFVTSKENRQVYMYLPVMREGKAKARLNGSDNVILAEGDGALVRGVDEGDELGFESIGDEVLDANHN